MSFSLNKDQIAWIAGLFEGEASFGLDALSARKYKLSTSPPNPYARISMVDEDVIKMVATLLNKSYFSPARKTATGKQVYILHIGDRKTLSYLLPRLLPYLGKRRTQQVQECIDALFSWEKWYSKGGRNEMAKQGAIKKKLVASKSDDMMSPDVSEKISEDIL